MTKYKPIINPKTGKPFVYMSYTQAKSASEKRGGIPWRPKFWQSWVLVLETT